MRRIPLRRRDGTIRARAIVDDADYARLVEHRWGLASINGHQYASRSDKGRTIYMHREIVGAPAGMDVDHEDGDGLNNRRSNLRLASRADNKHNHNGPRADSKSGVRGVYWHEGKQRWVGECRVGPRRFSQQSRDRRVVEEAILRFRRENVPFSPEARAA